MSGKSKYLDRSRLQLMYAHQSFRFTHYSLNLLRTDFRQIPKLMLLF